MKNKKNLIKTYNSIALTNNHLPWDYSYKRLSEFDKGILISLLPKKIIFKPKSYKKFFMILSKKERFLGFIYALISIRKRRETIENYKRITKKDISRSKFRYNILLEYLSKEKVKNKKILDVGCGTFPCFDKISKDNKVYGIDISTNMASHAKETWKTDDITIGDVEKVPFPNQSFEIVSCFGVLIFYKNLEKSISELMRVAKKVIIFDLFDSEELPYLSPCWLNSNVRYYLGRYHEPYQHDIKKVIKLCKEKGFILQSVSTFADGISDDHKILICSKNEKQD